MKGVFAFLLVQASLVFVQADFKAECDLVPADFVFLLDSSGSETTRGFKTQLAFISNFTSNFEVGADKAQFAAVTFSTGVHKNFYLNEHATQASVLDAINKIQYTDGETYTDLGLNFVRNNVLQANHGARPNVAKYVIVLTDGRSNDNSKTVQAAMALHNVPNVTVIAIGIGHAIDVNELHIIATDRNHSFVVNNFDLLHTLEVELVDKTCTLCGDYPADIAFLIDSSGSESGAQFDNERNFVSMVTNEFAINSNDTMVAVSQFATTARTDIFFNQYPDKESLLNAIARIHWMNGESNTHSGLNELSHHVFQVKSHSIHHGHHGHQTVTYGPRSESAKIAIVLTDGRSLEPDQTIRAAHQLHNMGVEVFVIGMGHWVDGVELNQIATDGDHVYKISSTNDLASIHTNIVDAICKLKVPPPTTTPMPTTTTTLPTTTVKQACGQKPANIVFLLDASESELAEGFAKEIQFVYNFARKFHIGPQNVQFSSVTFSSNVRNDFFLNTYSNRHDVLNAIQKISYMQGGTNTSFGLKFVRDNSFKPQNGARTNATKIVIVITGGQSADPADTKHEAQLLHHQGVLVYAVGVGSDVDSSELKAISSNGTPILVTDFWLLHDIQASLETAACHGGT
ncbi:collagen alpha-6(VI) chain-like isoform X2 [Crassostrea angulata]|uniref:collagen alpha-6(VI) chain-like isoform X2 n=1 Tax=Magallana angulata TaxID=2784310 RepID=UPI0022B1CD94|nr:collagen alpha-6(VI) chain-like isoform X2 [Crassostrea angulata]